MEERVVPVEEMKEAEEVFCTGTAAGIASVGSITFQNIRSLLLLLHIHEYYNIYILRIINLSVYKSAGLSAKWEMG